MMKAQVSQRTRYPESIDVLDIPDEVIEDDADAVDAMVTYQGNRIGVKQALAKMAADDATRFPSSIRSTTEDQTIRTRLGEPCRGLPRAACRSMAAASGLSL
jgi:hypothetical protein